MQEEFKEMRTEKISSKEANIKLPWVHTAIGNAKKVLQGIYHHVRPEYLQNYLDEFCYKLNRTYFGNKIFDRLLVACTLT
ncbi:transposase [Chondrinema litorale]|uniref:transposase n=1 Tax=Chondrinema litorale TaxID=2994555 RepID=UPI003D6DA961